MISIVIYCTCGFYLSRLHSAAFLTWLMAALYRTKKGTSNLHFSVSYIKIDMKTALLHSDMTFENDNLVKLQQDFVD